MTCFGPGTVDSGAFRKYDVVIDDTISADIVRKATVSKIGHGRKSTVTIVTTPSGTYSTDGLLSPHVRYPGIEVKPKDGASQFSFRYAQRTANGYWSLLTQGSFTYITYRLVDANLSALELIEDVMPDLGVALQSRRPMRVDIGRVIVGRFAHFGDEQRAVDHALRDLLSLRPGFGFRHASRECRHRRMRTDTRYAYAGSGTRRCRWCPDRADGRGGS